MADPVNYCSWIVKSYCVTQSEWATWTQAILTVVTFAIALWRQERTASKAALEKNEAARMLEAEKLHNTEMRARAAAISLRSEVIRFCSVMDALREADLEDSPAEAFKAMDPHLDVRLRAREAIELMAAADSVLKVVHGAQSLHDYLNSCKNRPAFEPSDYTFLRDTANNIYPIAERAQEEVGNLLYSKNVNS